MDFIQLMTLTLRTRTGGLADTATVASVRHGSTAPFWQAAEDTHPSGCYDLAPNQSQGGNAGACTCHADSGGARQCQFGRIGARPCQPAAGPPCARPVTAALAYARPAVMALACGLRLLVPHRRAATGREHSGPRALWSRARPATAAV